MTTHEELARWLESKGYAECMTSTPMPDVTGQLNAWCHGDARENRHAKACGTGKYGCWMSCSCWCHGLKKFSDGSLRPDAEANA